MPFVPQGGTTSTAETRVFVRATPGGSLIDPDAGTLVLRIHDPSGNVIVTVTETGLTRISLGIFAYAWAVASDQATGTYAWVWDGLVNGVDLPPAVDQVDVIPAGVITSTLVSIDDVRALVDCKQTDPQLLDIISREEAELASSIGPLAGPRTETFYPEARTPLFLLRPTASVVVTDVGTVVPNTTILLTGGGTRLTRYRSAQTSVAGAYWIGPVTVTYTPIDVDKVARVVIELCRLTLTETGYEAETIGDYAYNKRGSGTSTESRRARLIASLRPRRGPFSIRVDGATARPPVWVANVGWDHEI